MVKGVLLIYTPKDAVPLIGLMHPARRGPITTNGFEPAHPNIDLGLEEDGHPNIDLGLGPILLLVRWPQAVDDQSLCG